MPPNGTVILCGSGSGVLPTGTCTVAFSLSATNNGLSGTGTLVPGAATFNLVLKDSVGTGIDTASVAITLLPNHPLITAITLSRDSAFIDGRTTPFTATLENPGTARSGMGIQGWILQGTTLRAANGTVISCGSGQGVLPTGTCTVAFELSASNSAGGTGTFVPGAATFELDLRDSTGAVIDKATKAITLQPNTPRITALNLSTTTVAINGPTVPFTTTLDNPDLGSHSGVSIQGFIVQGTKRVPANGTVVLCGQSAGVLPTNSCTMSFELSASNANGGSLVPGAATFELDLRDSTGAVWNARSVAVTLVTAPISITALSLASDTAVIGGSAVRYSVTINNPGATRQFVEVVSNIIQGTAVRRANAAFVNCGGLGTLPTGTCVYTANFVASNTGSGSGTLVPGAATLEADVVDASTGKVLAKKTVSVVLTNP